jgi:predicted ATPase
MLMAFPNATIYSFDAQAIRPIAYQDVEHVQIMKSFLEHPQRYLRHL